LRRCCVSVLNEGMDSEGENSWNFVFMHLNHLPFLSLSLLPSLSLCLCVTLTHTHTHTHTLTHTHTHSLTHTHTHTHHTISTDLALEVRQNNMQIYLLSPKKNKHRQTISAYSLLTPDRA